MKRDRQIYEDYLAGSKREDLKAGNSMCTVNSQKIRLIPSGFGFTMMKRALGFKMELVFFDFCRFKVIRKQGVFFFGSRGGAG